MYGFYNGCIGQYEVIFWEQLLGYPGYPAKCTQIFPLTMVVGTIIVYNNSWFQCILYPSQVADNLHPLKDHPSRRSDLAFSDALPLGLCGIQR